jgi:hypothetical protein
MTQHTIKPLSSRASLQPVPKPENGGVGTAEDRLGTLSQRGVFKVHESVDLLLSRHLAREAFFRGKASYQARPFDLPVDFHPDER